MLLLNEHPLNFSRKFILVRLDLMKNWIINYASIAFPFFFSFPLKKVSNIKREIIGLYKYDSDYDWSW